MSERIKDKIPLIEELEKEITTLKQNVADIISGFERIYALVPDPVMKTNPEDGRPEALNPSTRIPLAILSLHKENAKLYDFGRKINTTFNEALGAQDQEHIKITPVNTQER